MAHFGRRFGNRFGADEAANIYAAIQPEYPSRRDLSWTPQHSDSVTIIAMDGQEVGRIKDEATELENVLTDARELACVEVWEASPTNHDESIDRFLTTPLDCVDLEWDESTGDPSQHDLKRSTTSGVYSDPAIAVIAAGETPWYNPATDAYTYQDGPLADDTYYWRDTVRDEAGNAVNSNEVIRIISSAPDAPTSVIISHDDGTGMTTISWTKSTSADVTGYNRYGGDPPELTAAPTDLGDVATCQIDNSAITGHVEYLITAYDAASNESAALSAMVAIDLDAGAQILRPNTPLIMNAEAIAGGEIRITARYDKRNQEAQPATIKMFGNDGAGGPMDWGTIKGTVNVDANKTLQIVEVESSGLTGGLTYLVGIRARTTGGIYDENINTESVLTDDTAPSVPILSGVIV